MGQHPYMTYSYLDAYLVAHSTRHPPLGVVRREGHVWRYFVFEAGEQSREVFETREDAARALERNVASRPHG